MRQITIVENMIITIQSILNTRSGYTFPKKPWEPRIQKSILSLNISNSVGKLWGILNVSEHIEAVGKTAVSGNKIEGEESGNPRGGTLSHPVRKTITSFRFGEHLSPFAV